MKSVLDRLYARADFARRRAAAYVASNYDLDRMRALLRALGDPQGRLRIVHVAGTKGKGSTCTFVERIARHRGLRTGLTVSPHVVDERERIQIDGRPISWSRFKALFEKVDAAAAREAPGATVFDVFIAMALLAFAEAKVDLAVVEVGLGGRLDSTNVVLPAICLITRIDFDHVDKLGHTLRAIAGEKAGILKTGVPVLVAPQDPEAKARIVEIRKKVPGPIRHVAPRPKLLPAGMPPFHAPNLALALAACETLEILPKGSTKKTLPSALKRILLEPFPARYEKRGRLLFDGAHNPVSMRALVSSLKRDGGFLPAGAPPPRLVFWCLPDKDLKAMLAHVPRAWKLHFFDFRPEWLPASFTLRRNLPKDVPVHRTLSELEAFDAPGQKWIFTGSFHFAGWVRGESPLEKRSRAGRGRSP